MTRRCRLLAPILLCDLSLTSSRHLDRLFSHSEARFSTTRNQSRFRLLHSDYPLYFTSFESPRLNLNKRAYQDRYCLFVPCACAVANQSVLYGGFEHWPDQPNALFVLSVLAFEALNDNGRNPFRLGLVTRPVLIRRCFGFAPSCCCCKSFPMALCSSGCLISLCMEVAVSARTFVRLDGKLSGAAGNSLAAIGQYMAVSSATGT